MEKFFEDLKKTVTRATDAVVKKSGELFENSKLSIAISAANSDIKEEYEKIGKLIYDGYKDNEVSSEQVTEHCEIIDAKFAEIEMYRQKLNDIKSVRTCPICKAEVSKESTFCAKCGQKL